MLASRERQVFIVSMIALHKLLRSNVAMIRVPTRRFESILQGARTAHDWALCARFAPLFVFHAGDYGGALDVR
jgi:hypothetical protein